MGDVGNAGASAGAAAAGAVMNDHGSWLLAACLPVTVTVTVELGLGTLEESGGDWKVGTLYGGNTPRKVGSLEESYGFGYINMTYSIAFHVGSEGDW